MSNNGLLIFRCDTHFSGELQMTKERLEEAERILASYAAKYGLGDEARDYFAKWGTAKELLSIGMEEPSERQK